MEYIFIGVIFVLVVSSNAIFGGIEHKKYEFHKNDYLTEMREQEEVTSWGKE